MSRVIRRIPDEIVTKQVGGGVACPKCGCGNWKRTVPQLCSRCNVMEVPDPARTITRRIPGYIEIICDCGETVACTGFTNTCERCGRDYNWNGTLLAPRSYWGEETGETEANILGPK